MMTVLGLIDETEIKQELVYFFRNSDVFSISERGVTTAVDTGTFSSSSSHTLNTTPTLLKNVRSVVVSGVTLVYGKNYTINKDTGVISFVVTQTGAYVISYDVGNSDKIWGDFPQVDLKINSYPRLAIGITSVRTQENELGGVSNISDFLISVYVYAKGTTLTDDYVKLVREKILENKTSFYYLRFITPTGTGPMINEPARSEKIFTRVTDFSAPLNIEVIQ